MLHPLGRGTGIRTQNKSSQRTRASRYTIPRIPVCFTIFASSGQFVIYFDNDSERRSGRTKYCRTVQAVRSTYVAMSTTPLSFNGRCHYHSPYFNLCYRHESYSGFVPDKFYTSCPCSTTGYNSLFNLPSL